MTDSDIRCVLALVTVPHALEEVVIDTLLSHEATSAFTSVAAHGHGTDHAGLSLAEQVSGRRKQIQFQIELAESDVPGLLAALLEAIPGGDCHCCLLPLHPLSSTTLREQQRAQREAMKQQSHATRSE